MSNGIVRIEFHTDNAAFEDYRTLEIADILKDIAENIENDYRTEGVILDFNGCAIGTWTTNGTNENLRRSILVETTNGTNENLRRSILVETLVRGPRLERQQES